MKRSDTAAKCPICGHTAKTSDPIGKRFVLLQEGVECPQCKSVLHPLALIPVEGGISIVHCA